jgi:hypothetical protein
MDRPVSISRYILIKTAEPLSKEEAIAWFRCAKEFLPSGIMATCQTTDNKGNLRGASMVQREISGCHEYIIPLTRDLLERETEIVVEACCDTFEDKDFEIAISTSQEELVQHSPSVELDKSKYIELCTNWAKKQHDTWFKDRIDNGWRFGTTISLKNKTHPLLRPWYELPDRFRKIDTDQPQSLIDLLNSQGYAVISREELESIMKLLKSIVK